MKSKKYKFPVKYIKENIMFTDKNVFAAFKLEGVEYSSKSTDEKVTIWESFQDLIKAFPDGKSKIYLIPRTIFCENAIQPMIDKVDEEDTLYETTEVLLEETMRILNGRAEDRYVYDEALQEEKFVKGDKEVSYDIYLLISLKEALEGDFISKGGEIFEYMLKDPIQGVNKLLGVSDKYISETRFRYLKKKSNEFLEEQANYFNIRPISKVEAINLVTRVTKRGHISADEIFKYSNYDSVEIEDDGEKVIIPIEENLKNKVEGKITQGNKMIEIEHDDFTSYQSFVALSDVPNLQLIGGEFIKYIQDSYQCEICIDINKLSTEVSKREINNRGKKVNSQIAEASDSGHEIDDGAIEAKIATDELASEVRRSKHILETKIVFCIASTEKKLVERTVKELISDYKKLEFKMICPYTDQYKLFLDSIPAADGFCNDYIEPMAIKNLAGAMFGSNDKLGDNYGVYIGYTKYGNKKVYLYLGRAAQENKSPATLIIGNLGYGKSFNANLILMLHVLTGSSALIFDPKSERGHWKEKLPFLQGLISIVRLTASDKDAGKLDPFNLYKDDIDEATTLAFNIICDIAKVNDETQTVLNEVLKNIKNDDNPSMMRLIEMLYEVPKDDLLGREAYLLARKLSTMKDVGLSKLIFGDGTEDAIELDNRINILQIDNLKMPEAEDNKDNYSEEERLSTALLTVMTNFTKKFAMKKRNTFDLVLFDESWFLKDTKDGRKMYDFIARQGRSLNVGSIFNGHTTLDIPDEGVRNALTYKFCFHTDNRDEAERMLELLNMETSDENIKMIMKLENREALFQDLDGRTGVIVFDAIFDMFIDCFNTKPKDTLKV
ncbi:ATP-binding protein [Clostridium baratii]|uniref:ATP-binding protein n=1 Tax=Clostridium baratii TaxID=1561 RepID=UPI0030D07752